MSATLQPRVTDRQAVLNAIASLSPAGRATLPAIVAFTGLPLPAAVRILNRLHREGAAWQDGRQWRRGNLPPTTAPELTLTAPGTAPAAQLSLL